MPRITDNIPDEPQGHIRFRDVDVDAFGRIREGLAAMPLAFQEAIVAARDFTRISYRMASSLEQDLKEQLEAYNRSEALLMSCLNKEQKADYEDHKAFNVTLGHLGWKRTYRIYTSKPVVARLYRGIETWYCVISSIAYIPTPDLMLAIKMLIESNERKFLEIANVTNIYKGKRVVFDTRRGRI